MNAPSTAYAAAATSDLRSNAVLVVDNFHLVKQVQQIPGCGVLFTARYGQAGVLVEVSQQRHPVAAQDRLHRAAGKMPAVGGALRSPAASEARVDDPPLGSCRGPVRAAMWTTGAILHRRRTIGPVAIGPSLRGGRQALEPFSIPPRRPTPFDNHRPKLGPNTSNQTGICVDHEAFSVIGCMW